MPQTAQIITSGEIDKHTLIYDFSIVAEAELFEWVDCPPDKKEEKIEQIRSACENNFNSFLECLPFEHYCEIEDRANDKLVYTSYDLKQIRFADIKTKLDIGDNRVTNAEIKIRINPCLAANFEEGDTHHSKVWAIIRTLDELNIDGRELANAVQNIRKIALELLAKVRPCYLEALEETAPKDVLCRVSMKYAALDDRISDIDEFYLGLDDEGKAQERLRSTQAMQASLGDLVRQQNLSSTFSEDPINALRCIKDEQIWQIGSEETEFDQVYRIKLSDEYIDVSDITMVPTDDLKKKNELLYESFLPLALRFSWGL